jgi:hypothetical protein
MLEENSTGPETAVIREFVMETRPLPKPAHAAGQTPPIRSAHEATLTPPGKNGEHPTGYGLPCARCKTYYAADVRQCPVCGETQRGVPRVAPVPASALKQPAPQDPETIQEERDRFLRDFKPQVDEEGESVPSRPAQMCNQKSSHPEGGSPAKVCQACFDSARQRADKVEAALHMDLQEAAKIVYEAVWADTSDPGKTYENAAEALLTEIKRRAGLPSVLGAARGFAN